MAINTSDLIAVADEPAVPFLADGRYLLVGISYEDATGAPVAGGGRTVRVRYTIPRDSPDAGNGVLPAATKLAGGVDGISLSGDKWAEFDLWSSVRQITLTAELAGAADPIGATHYRLTVHTSS